MKRLLLHLGYPKSASTTLQNGLFYELHKSNVTNFIGKAWESGYYGPAGSKKKYKAWLRTISRGEKRRVTRLASERMPISFSDDKLNVMSEELFIVRDNDHDQPVMPDRIHAYFGEKVDEAELLFVVRNQQTLILSYFVQTYPKIEQTTFSDYLREVISTPLNVEAGVFNFRNLIGRYADVMGKKNIHIVFFEDFLYDRETCGRELADILGVEPELVGELLSSVHFNRTPKHRDGYVVRKTPRTQHHGALKQLTSSALRLAGVVPETSEPIVIPDMTEEEKSMIFSMFRDNNKRFAEEFQLDGDRMHRYGYF